MHEFVQQFPLVEDMPVFSSPYRRAQETAQIFGFPIQTDVRLIERKIGERSAFTKEMWRLQYQDADFKSEDGESFREVRCRMTAALKEILVQLPDGGAAVVVSHATAICAYLQQFCTVEVTDTEHKLRRITFQGKIVLDGAIRTPSAFVLEFENGQLLQIAYRS